MITPSRLRNTLLEHLPEIEEHVQGQDNEHQTSSYIIEGLTKFTRVMVNDHNLEMAERCFKAADMIYQQGDTQIKNDIENIFVFAISTFLMTYADDDEKAKLEKAIPVDLHHLYVNQILLSHD